MLVARTINFVTEPPYAEVVMDGNRIGFTPTTTIANAGNHNSWLGLDPVIKTSTSSHWA
jgi:hypothetical protein